MATKKEFAVLILTILAVTTPPGPLLFCQDTSPANWKERFKGEAPGAWSKYRVGAARLQGSMTTTVSSLSPKKNVLAEVDSEFKQCANCAIMAGQDRAPLRRGKKSEWELSGANASYRFNLKRRDANSPWALAYYGTDLITDPPPGQPNLSVTGWVKACVSAPITINYNLKDDWPAILSARELNLISVSPVDGHGTKLVKVEFDLDWAASNKNLIRVVKRGARGLIRIISG